MRKYQQFKHYDNFGMRKEIECVTYITLGDCALGLVIVPLALQYEILIFWAVFQTLCFTTLIYLIVIYPKKLQAKYNVGLTHVSKLNIMYKKSIPKSRHQIHKPQASVGSSETSSNSNQALTGHDDHSRRSVSQLDLSMAASTSIDNLQQVKHWSQIVVTPFGYQVFINHLQNEFCVENLLFLTEVCRMQFGW